MKHETDLFGPKAPYQGWIVGSPLNNYLVDNGGKRNIVFLDEFEKTTEEVWQALLLVLDSGKCKNSTTDTGMAIIDSFISTQ